MTLPRRSFLFSSFAKTQGVVSSIYLFVRLINLHIAESATENSMLSIAFSTSVTTSILVCSKLLSSLFHVKHKQLFLHQNNGQSSQPFCLISYRNHLPNQN